MDDFFFKSFAYTAQENSIETHVAKKPRQSQSIDYEDFCNPNILVFCIQSGKTEWILADPGGEVLQDSLSTDPNNLQDIINFAIEHNCTVVTHDKQAACRKLKTINEIPIFCTMKSSANRCGVVRMDGQRKFASCEDLYFSLFGQQSDKTSNRQVLDILHVFIQGRMHGWW